MSESKKSKLELWTLKQRKTLLGLSVVLLLFLFVEAIRKPVRLADPPTDSASRAGEIQDRLDPNTADAAELSAIPNLGEIRARDIVEYREAFKRHYPNRAAFASAADLMRVKGIGPGISSSMEPYLIFPGK